VRIPVLPHYRFRLFSLTPAPPPSKSIIGRDPLVRQPQSGAVADLSLSGGFFSYSVGSVHAGS